MHRTRESRFRPGRGQTTLCATGAGALVGLRADDVKAVSIERLCLSLLMSNNLYSKVINSFVPELRSRKVICVYFGFPMSISHIRISAYVTVSDRISLSLYIYIYIYICTHTHTHTHTYIYIYIYIYIKSKEGESGMIQFEYI